MVLRRSAMTKRGASLQRFIEGFLDQTLGARIDRGGRFVEDQDSGIGQCRAGDGDQLTLSLAEAGAAFAEHGLILLRQAIDKYIRVRHPGGGDDFLVGRIGAAKADILHDAGAEQEGILQDDADLRAQALRCNITHIDAIDADGALTDVIETRQQVDDGGLACAGRADDGEGLPRQGGE